MMKFTKYTFSILLFLALTQSCKVGPNFQSVPPEELALTQDSFRYDSTEMVQQDSALNLKWWKLFQDPVLDTLIAVGLRENKDVLIAASRIDQSLAMVGQTKADYYPKLGYQAGFSSGNVFAGVPTEGGSSTTIYSGFGTLNWEIDFWGKYRRSNEAARAELAANEYALRTVQIGLISLITGNYFLYLDYKSRLDISRKTVVVRDEYLQIVQERYNEGIIPEIDVNQAQIQKAIAQAAVPFYERALAQTENILSVLLGQNPGALGITSTLQDQVLPPDIPAGLPSQLLVRRPDLLQSQEILHAQNARVGVAIAQRYPSFNLTGLLGVASTDLSMLAAGGPAWSAGLNLLGPLFEFGKNKRRVELEKYKTEQALYEYEKTVLTAFQEVEDALIEIETLKDEVIARQDHVRAATRAETLSKERYDKGVTSYLELLESQRQAFDAQLQLSQVTQELLNGYTLLYKSLGGGWLSEQEMTIATTPPPAQN
jgi:multidrug efflux system outer membrane protein